MHPRCPGAGTARTGSMLHPPGERRGDAPSTPVLAAGLTPQDGPGGGRPHSSRAALMPQRGGGSGDAEGGEAFGGFGVDGYGVDDGQAGGGAGTVGQVTDAGGRAFEDGFDPAVGQVADPAGHVVLPGQAAA